MGMPPSLWTPIVADDGDRREDRSATSTMGRIERYDRVFESVDEGIAAGL
ncbi:MAG TPA: hypothetical protein VFM38_03875 [Candidatus Limnocylindrales bacterium]|nr:hypothetical protein [Candidatus Limnocylindrales bacterium]